MKKKNEVILDVIGVADVLRMFKISYFRYKSIRDTPAFPKPLSLPGKPKWKREVMENYIKNL